MGQASDAQTVREQGRIADPAGQVRGKHRGRPSSSGRLVGALFIAGPIVGILLLFLWPYVGGRLTTPIGGDTPWYIARQQTVETSGLDAIGDRRAGGPRGPKALGDRPGYPIVTSLTSAVTAVDAFDLAYVLPAAAAVALGLAAGAFGIAAMREPSWAFPVYALAVGTSTLVARTAVQSHDNLLADVMLVAAGAFAIRAADGAHTRAAAVILITAAAVTHWRFVVPFGLLMAAVGLLMLPDLVRRLRSGDGLRDAPATRYWSILGGSALAGTAALALTPSFSLQLPKVRTDRVADKTQEWIPPMRLPLLGTTAAAGAVLSWWPKDRVRRWGLAMLMMWGLSVPLAMVLESTIARNVPTYRVAAFALGIPLLVGAALAGLGRLSLRWGVVGATVGALLVVAGLVGNWRLGADLWWAEQAIMTPQEVEQFTAAATYMRDHPLTPVVFVVEKGHGTGPGRAMRAVLPVELTQRAFLYLGLTENLLDQRPTLRQDARYDRESQKLWAVIQPLLDEDPIILRPVAYAAPGTETGEEISPGLTLVQGPPANSLIPGSFISPSPTALVLGSLGVLAVWSLVGAGWAMALAPLGWLGRLGSAPALGVAVLTLLGLAVGRIGVPLSDLSGIVVVVVASAGGVAAWWLGHRGSSDTGSR